jgi:hypothetical protein
MFEGPALVIDKSTLQSLSDRESQWLFHFFHVVLTPTLFLEIRADLTKAARAGKTPEEEVAIIASKIRGFGATINMDHLELCIGDLLGYLVEMRGVPALGGGKEVVDNRGRVGMVFDEQPEIKALRRWSEGDFSDEDWEFAQFWRDTLENLDLAELQSNIGSLKRATQKVTTLSGILDVVDAGLGAPGIAYKLLKQTLNLLLIPESHHRRIIAAWKKAGHKQLGIYAPYANHVARVEMFFFIALARELIAPYPNTNRIDISYLYYLPFCQVFASNDRLHKRTVPLFITNKKMFVPGEDLKLDMAALASYYEGMPEEVTNTGSMTYARYPPREGNFLTAQIYDRVHPNWREWAARPSEKRTPEQDAKTIENLRPIMEAIEKMDN